MKRDQPLEKDWQLFRKIVPELRERYVAVRNAEIMGILGDESLSPTEKFWVVSERMEEIESILSICLDDHRRSRMVQSIMLMHQHGMISDQDLVGFSDEVRERVANYAEMQKIFAEEDARAVDDPQRE